METIYRFHPLFGKSHAHFRWGDDEENTGPATIEGGDVMPIGNGTVLIGMGERSSPQATGQVAMRLLSQGAVNRVIAWQLPKS
ncbi:MAG: arginine deiminase [Granulosicoccus sp.]|jgi:arginine deiminase